MLWQFFHAAFANYCLKPVGVPLLDAFLYPGLAMFIPTEANQCTDPTINSMPAVTLYYLTPNHPDPPSLSTSVSIWSRNFALSMRRTKVYSAGLNKPSTTMIITDTASSTGQSDNGCPNAQTRWIFSPPSPVAKNMSWIISFQWQGSIGNFGKISFTPDGT